MECDCNPIHGRRIICNWSRTTRIWVLLYHLTDDRAELIHRSGLYEELLWVSRSDTSEKSPITRMRAETGKVLLVSKAYGTKHEQGRPSLSASWPRGRSILKLMYHMAHVDTSRD